MHDKGFNQGVVRGVAMTVTYHDDLIQGTDEWLAARRGIITASEMNLVLTPSLKPPNNEKTRQHVFEIAAQRITEWTEPTYIGEAMLRGHADEIIARDMYSQHVDLVEEVGFITRDFGDFTIGYSPDGAGILGTFGIECKSRVQKHHIKTVIADEVPQEHMLQLQTGLLVTGWEYIDYISFCAGMPMWIITVLPDQQYFDAILGAAAEFEAAVRENVAIYEDRLKKCSNLLPTERQEEQEIYIA